MRTTSSASSKGSRCAVDVMARERVVKERVVAERGIGAGGVFGRFLGALVLVFATFNPSGYSFFHWAMHHSSSSPAVIALAGIILVIAWVLFLRATMLSLGILGVALALAFF